MNCPNCDTPMVKTYSAPCEKIIISLFGREIVYRWWVDESYCEECMNEPSDSYSRALQSAYEEGGQDGYEAGLKDASIADETQA